MARIKKLQAIEDMGIEVRSECPDDYSIGCCCKAWNQGYATEADCQDCWIKSLEDEA